MKVKSAWQTGEAIAVRSEANCKDMLHYMHVVLGVLI